MKYYRHIFSKCLVFQIKNVFQTKNVVLRSKTLDSIKKPVFQIKNFEKLGFENLERNTYYFENLEFHLESWYRENNSITQLYLFVSYVCNITQRRNARLKKN